MNIALCADERMGLLFQGRRQSQDRRMREDLLMNLSGCLWMNAYSGRLFGPHPSIRISEDFLAQASPSDVCFVENTDFRRYESSLRQIILYRWNRHYPADVFFPFSLSDGGWKLSFSTDFQGFSHDRITKEVYIR